MSGPLRRHLRSLAAFAAGAATALAFEPVGWAWLLPFAVAALSLTVRGLHARHAFGLGVLYGAGFMLLLLPWLRVIGSDAWVGLSLMQAVFYALLGVALARVGELRWWPLWSAACWVAAEFLRGSVPWGGFPWGRLAYATIDTPIAPVIRAVGAAGTSFLVALSGCLLAWAVVAVKDSDGTALLRPEGATVTRAAVAAVLGAGLLWLAPSGVASAWPSAGRADSTLRVAAVQGNVPGEGMTAFAERRAVLDNHVEATLGLADRIQSGATERPELVLWPESSTDIDPFVDPTAYADIQGAVDAVGVPVLVGAMVTGPGPQDIRNQGILWRPGTGPSQRYSKTHPVPFGEYIPMRAQLATLFERLDQIPRDMVPGTSPGLFQVAGTTVGDLICFEVAYDQVVRDVMDAGARLLVVQTNNATYMGTGQVEQQFAIARLRALETQRYVAVVATNGVSGLIGPDGSVVARAPVREPAVLEAGLGLLDVRSPAVMLGPWLERALLLAALAALVAGARSKPARGAASEATGRPVHALGRTS